MFHKDMAYHSRLCGYHWQTGDFLVAWDIDVTQACDTVDQ
jgi:hypothetical protein